MKGTFGATGYVCPHAEGREMVNPMKVADTYRLRAIGLMCRRDVPADYGSGLFFPHCRSLHTFWMRFPLDIVFLDADMQPVAIRRGVPPWRMLLGPKSTVHCFEVRGGLLPEEFPERVDWA